MKILNENFHDAILKGLKGLKKNLKGTSSVYQDAAWIYLEETHLSNFLLGQDYWIRSEKHDSCGTNALQLGRRVALS